jgi:hypothetical protein
MTLVGGGGVVGWVACGGAGYVPTGDVPAGRLYGGMVFVFVETRRWRVSWAMQTGMHYQSHMAKQLETRHRRVSTKNGFSIDVIVFVEVS